MNKPLKNNHQQYDSGKGLLASAVDRSKDLYSALFKKKSNPPGNGMGEAVTAQPPNEWKELVMHAPVVLLQESTDKENAFQLLLHECCSANPDIDEKSTFKSLLERESQGATFVGSDIAIPHARPENIQRPVLVIGVSKKGVVDRQSGNSARIIFLLLTPASDPNSHIRMLGVITRMASDKEWRAKTIREAGSNRG
ncbi:PTS sugar transporter subunit IIA [Chlorobium sp. BLA1]|uniref:PTS sugar transporter subunit IIA n=1 Tax=Candidatus Chlorobium masyuteum TaxID=2716876 RepID=UPI0014207E3B|nr:PTS sugar transporter subunit IIA [Candidatus Chlorobium masyuteum]NHQ60448.1 PTS sugar transporter subunit IIA [Candidatus Chlorobium masyuteum]NTU43974.1 PTS sugar transporter subunit IIA [Chlorobiaceae bacterium]